MAPRIEPSHALESHVDPSQALGILAAIAIDLALWALIIWGILWIA